MTGNFVEIIIGEFIKYIIYNIIFYWLQTLFFRCYSNFKEYLKIDDDGYLCWNKTAINIDGYSSENLWCSYKEIWRPSNNDFGVIYDEEKPFLGKKVKLKSDFVYVQCNNWFNVAVYKDFLAHAQRLTDIRKYKVSLIHYYVFYVIKI